MSEDQFEQRLRKALHREAYRPMMQLDSETLRERLAQPARHPSLWRGLSVAAVLAGLIVLVATLAPRPVPILAPSTPSASPAACETSELTQHGSWWTEAGGPGAFFHLETTALYATAGSNNRLLIVRFDPDAESDQEVAVWAERLEDGLRVDGVYNSPMIPEGIGRFEETAPLLPGGWYLFEQRLPFGGCWQLTAAIGEEEVGTAVVSVIGPADLDAAVEILFANTDECSTELAGHAVTITYPDTWWTNEASGESGCLWFYPEQMAMPGAPTPEQVPMPDPASRPAGIAITFGAAGGPFGSWGTPALTADVMVAGRQAVRVEELGSTPGYGDGHPALVYQVALGETPDVGPTLVAITREQDYGDYELNRAVLDRMMDLIVIE